MFRFHSYPIYDVLYALMFVVAAVAAAVAGVIYSETSVSRFLVYLYYYVYYEKTTYPSFHCKVVHH